MAQQIVWQYESEFRGSWKDMDAKYAQMYEAVSCGEKHDVMTYSVPYAGGQRSYQYEVDFRAMTQKNLITGTVRKIRRLILQTPCFDI